MKLKEFGPPPPIRQCGGLYCLVVEPRESKVRISGRDAEPLLLEVATEPAEQRRENHEQTGWKIERTRMHSSRMRTARCSEAINLRTRTTNIR